MMETVPREPKASSDELELRRRFTVLLGSAIWWAYILVAYAIGLLSPLQSVIVFLAWILAYQLLRRNRGTLRAVAIVTAVIVACFIGLRIYGIFSWDPIGQGTDDGWGYAWKTEEIARLSNGKHKVVSLRRAWCSDGPLTGMVYTSFFVFVHETGTAETPESLVLRYEPTEVGWGRSVWPRLTWQTPSLLRIAVSSGAIEQLTKQRFAVDGVRIEYDLGQAQEPAMTFWQRP